MSLAREGELDVLADWLRDELPSEKFLALLTGAPDATTTMLSMKELSTPGLNGYERQRISPAEWGTSELDNGDYHALAEVTFGPATLGWGQITHVALVTSRSWVDGRFLLSVPLPEPVTIRAGQSFKYELSVKVKA